MISTCGNLRTIFSLILRIEHALIAEISKEGIQSKIEKEATDLKIMMMIPICESVATIHLRERFKYSHAFYAQPNNRRLEKLRV